VGWSSDLMAWRKRVRCEKGSHDTCKCMTRFAGFEGFYEADGLLDVMDTESKKAER
jgi:hypothetical protein